MSEQLTITVVGVGAMGLPIATNLSDHGFTVRGVDIAEARLQLCREAGLEAYDNAVEAVDGADVVLSLIHI